MSKVSDEGDWEKDRESYWDWESMYVAWLEGILCDVFFDI